MEDGVGETGRPLRIGVLMLGLGAWWRAGGVVGDVERPGFLSAVCFRVLWRTQGLTVHLRLPKAVSDDPMSFLESEPSGSSKAKVTEEICPSLKEAGFLTHEGSCWIVRDA
jgi:hypothetical protein